jgi:hypothetical protein|tara:strand:+ start:4162 stop:5574 length:1413 start_codon:yes stop_codon:yes gene_type:complete
MNRPSSTLSALLLLLVMTATIAYKLWGGVMPLVVASVTLLAFLLLQWRSINTTGKVMLGVALVSLCLLNWSASPLQIATSAFSRSSFFATFLVSLCFLRLAAKHSLMVKRCGKLVVNQPPALRYGVISYAGTLFGTVLSFGVVHLIGQIIDKGNSLDAAGGSVRIQNIRRQRMSLALHRGFSVLPLASPFSITMALMLATIPGLEWQSLLPMGLTTAVMLIGLGWGFDYFNNPKLAPIDAQYRGPDLSWLPALQFAGLILAIFSVAALLAQMTILSLPLAILMISPVVGILWLTWGRRTADTSVACRRTTHILRQQLPAELNGLRSEIAILSGASFIGVIIADLIPQQQLVQLVQTLGLTSAPLAIVACALIPLFALTGIGPIVTVTVIASTLSSTTAFQLPPELLAIGLMSGWALAMNSSPISLSALMVSNTTGCSTRDLTLNWNGRYSLVSFVCISLWLLLLSTTLTL